MDESTAFESNRRAILEGVGLISDLVPIMEARRNGESLDTLTEQLESWNERRGLWVGAWKRWAPVSSGHL